MHQREWRHPAAVTGLLREAESLDPSLLKHKVRGAFWELLDQLNITLVVGREYEHLLMALSVQKGKPHVSFQPLPHPGGIAVDTKGGRMVVASTRNPNQLFTFKPVSGFLKRKDIDPPGGAGALVPVSTATYPGSLYLHDLAFIGGHLHGNAVGHNALVKFHADGRYERVWWPGCIDTAKGPRFGENLLQLNGIAAGANLKTSVFTASVAKPGKHRPGHLEFPVDGTGVVFDGKTRLPMATGLTRPHSPRFAQGRLWLANSGYGEVGAVSGGKLETLARLPGWTRGLCVVGDYLFAATSRVIARYAVYAPGLKVDASVCGVHVLDLHSGKVLGSMVWPTGYQIFALEALPGGWTQGFPFSASSPNKTQHLSDYYYAFDTHLLQESPR